jgi:hypothetical protein
MAALALALLVASVPVAALASDAPTVVWMADPQRPRGCAFAEPAPSADQHRAFAEPRVLTSLEGFAGLSDDDDTGFVDGQRALQRGAAAFTPLPAAIAGPSVLGGEATPMASLGDLYCKECVGWEDDAEGDAEGDAEVAIDASRKDGRGRYSRDGAAARVPWKRHCTDMLRSVQTGAWFNRDIACDIGCEEKCRERVTKRDLLRCMGTSFGFDDPKLEDADVAQVLVKNHTANRAMYQRLLALKVMDATGANVTSITFKIVDGTGIAVCGSIMGDVYGLSPTTMKAMIRRVKAGDRSWTDPEARAVAGDHADRATKVFQATVWWIQHFKLCAPILPVPVPVHVCRARGFAGWSVWEGKGKGGVVVSTRWPRHYSPQTHHAAAGAASSRPPTVTSCCTTRKLGSTFTLRSFCPR